MIGKTIKQTILFVAEYAAKGASVPIGLNTLASQESDIASRYVDGITSAPGLLGRTAKTLYEVVSAIKESHQVSAYEFAIEHQPKIAKAIENGYNWLMATGDNLIQQPLATITATLAAGLTAYGTGALMRFHRQQGQGSFIDQAVRRCGKKVYKLDK